MTNGSRAEAIVQDVVRSRPCGLLTDIDGTVSRIAEHPSNATVEPHARTLLERLAGKLDLVAAITGRSAEDARAIVGTDEIVYAGNHGMEIRRGEVTVYSDSAREHAPKIRWLLDFLRSSLQINGVYIEDKGLTASIHVRETEDPSEAERTVLGMISEHVERLDLVVTRGRMVVEIRPPVDLSKGTAVLQLIGEYELRGAVYIGDDITDVDAFHALQQRRARQGDHLYAIGVVDDGTPAEVIEAADGTVEGVDGVITLLDFVDRIT